MKSHGPGHRIHLPESFSHTYNVAAVISMYFPNLEDLQYDEELTGIANVLEMDDLI